jgi:HPt (histidine-containing phosphotransfer) domain-containing protein
MTTEFDQRFAEIRVRFRARCPAHADGLLSALAQNDRKRIGELAHAISGTAGMLGFDEISALARGLEQCTGGADDNHRVHAKLNELVDALIDLGPPRA